MRTQGMEDVVAAESTISWIDGAAGELRYRGYPVGELAEHCGFEDIAYLLWHGELPDSSRRAELRERLATARMDATRLLPLLESLPADAHPLDVLRYIVSWDALQHPLTWKNDEDSNRQK